MTPWEIALEVIDAGPEPRDFCTGAIIPPMARRRCNGPRPTPLGRAPGDTRLAFATTTTTDGRRLCDGCDFIEWYDGRDGDEIPRGLRTDLR